MQLLLPLLAASTAAQANVFHIPRKVPLFEDFPPRSILDKRRNGDEPCAQVSALWADQRAQSVSATTSIYVPAELAFECLQSIPVDVEGDIKEIQELKEYLEYQSTLAYLKTGVEGQIEPLDIMGSLDKMVAAIKDGTTFTSDYEVQFAIRALLDRAGDFHLQFQTDLTTVFQFVRVVGGIVSLSEDGLSLPKIYLQREIVQDDSLGFTPSPIISINGKNASEYLEDYSSGTMYHDADARYNTIFPNPTLQALGIDEGGLFLTHYVYDGANTTLAFANGTIETIENFAIIEPEYDFSTVHDGASFFQAFCQGPHKPPQPAGGLRVRATNPPTPTPAPTSKPSSSLPGYPKPIFIQESGRFSGYYFNESNYGDVAVLAVPSFDPTAIDTNLIPRVAGFVQTQQQVRSFFANSVKQGKKKLVIDLRGNGGGTIDMGFELFRQIFPTMEPYGATRYRAHEAFHYYSAIVADLAIEGTNIDGIMTSDWKDGDYGISSPFLWSNILDEKRQLYKNYSDYFGPYTLHDDTFTGVRRYNFSDNIGGHTLDVSLTGYNEQPTPSQPFQAENIIILQDGYCGSTCAIFSELMREQGKVQTIVFGGRPLNAPSQGVGGSKGAQILNLDDLKQFAVRTIKTAEVLDGEWIAAKLNDTTAVGRIYQATQIYKRTAHIPGTYLVGGINSLNNYREGDSTETPLEFIYDAADCRLFYTKETFLNPLSLWKQAADAKWGKGECVPGSMGHKTAIGVVNNQPFPGQRKSSSSTQNLTQTNSAASAISISGAAALFAAATAMLIVL
ncbi:hypothetical protein BKA66DRAFT_438985 [Pyrenochaeta sp. MPI-SDFR-AT-0127]|nr:hypothetical protein BKA66DRAFT_438985 [Pyrenochaeta sp. MPI-SDFR-AT-0127]